jgi:hypothetical protein
LLWFRSTSPAREACVVATKELSAMDAQLVEATIKTYLTEIRSRLDKAAGIGRAADACAGAGFHEKGLEVRLADLHRARGAPTMLTALDHEIKPSAVTMAPGLPDGFGLASR